jgi:hypothetical protein
MDFVAQGPVCDVTAHEIVWVTQPSNFSTIHRASATGGNARPVTTFSFDLDGADWRFANESGHFSNYRSDRLFFVRNDSTTNTGTLFYVSTTLPNTSRVALASITGVVLYTNTSVLSNATAVIASFLPTPTTYDSFSAPLPNGILSGAPPRFLAGNISQGVLDDAYFYGGVQFSAAIPTDAIVRCPVTGCQTPKVLYRGQPAQFFAQDETAIYWTTANASSGDGFTVWKAAK